MAARHYNSRRNKRIASVISKTGIKIGARNESTENTKDKIKTIKSSTKQTISHKGTLPLRCPVP